ncbi:MAG: imidazole glycerol phosphate synthase subunit HisH, partial [Thermoprotei archaeon]
MKVAVVDYGMGNLRGVKLAIERAGGRAVITNDPAEVTEADAIVLPGVGAFKDAMERLRSIEEVVKDQIRAGKPLLGICLGLQLLFTESMEGGLHRGLDLLKGRVVKLPAGVKVPHMGWNKVNIAKWTRFVEDLPQGAYMYFVHSFYADPLNKD